METDDRRKSMIPSSAWLVMGIIMILVYVGMGVLFFIDFFGWGQDMQPWPTLNYVCGVILVLYGIYRAYRLWKNIHPADDQD